MSTRVRQPVFPGGRWWLPVLLALIIAGIVVGIVLARNHHSAAKATPTPVRVTVVASPTPGTSASSTPAASSTATGPTPTPGGASPGPTATAGGSTPLPSATPFPTIAGVHVKLGMITHKQSDVQHIQSGASAGNSQYTYYLDPIQVVKNNLHYYGFTSSFTILAPAQPSPTPTATTDQLGRPLVRVTVQFQGHKFEIDLVQPAKRGPGGIWMVVTIRPLS